MQQRPQWHMPRARSRHVDVVTPIAESRQLSVACRFEEPRGVTVGDHDGRALQPNTDLC